MQYRKGEQKLMNEIFETKRKEEMEKMKTTNEGVIYIILNKICPSSVPLPTLSLTRRSPQFRPRMAETHLLG